MAVVAAVLGCGLAVAGTASATEGDGICSHNDAGAGGDLCLHFNSNLQGSIFNDPYWDNYSRDHNGVAARFASPGAGQVQLVENNTGSVDNFDQLNIGDVWFNSNQTGCHDVVPISWHVDRLSCTYNENASQGWGVS
jgi:hypothetical protein